MNDSVIHQQIERDAEAVLAAGVPRAAPLAVQAALTVLYLVIYYLATPLWAQFPRLYEILFERFVWPHAIVFVAMLALADLTTKLIAALMTGSLEPTGAGPEFRQLSPERLAELAARLRRKSQAVWYRRPTLRNRRLAMGLLQYARGESKQSVRDGLRAQAELDEMALASRYTLVKLFLWAIPLLGFIGTVEGIGAGIGQFSVELDEQTRLEAPAVPAPGEGAPGGSLERVRGSLQNVTGGLGRAFDTTYLALVLAVALMILMSLLEKFETDRQLAFDEYCQSHLAARLPADRALGAGELERMEQAAGAMQTAAGEAERATAGLSSASRSIDRLTGTLGEGLDLELKVRKRDE